MCPLSDQKDFEMCHHIREKRCATQFLWTRGHTVAYQQRPMILIFLQLCRYYQTSANGGGVAQGALAAGGKVPVCQHEGRVRQGVGQV